MTKVAVSFSGFASDAVLADYDAQLMASVQAGCTDSFDALVIKYRGPVLNYLFRMVHSYPIAEDLTQDVFLRVYRSRLHYEPRAKFTTWLYRIATNVALNHRRDRRHTAGHFSLDICAEDGTRAWEMPDQTPSAPDVLVKDVLAAQIRAAIAGLPEKQRSAVLLHKYSDLEYVQIARILDTTVPAVKSLLFRAYATLRLALKSAVHP